MRIGRRLSRTCRRVSQRESGICVTNVYKQATAARGLVKLPPMRRAVNRVRSPGRATVVLAVCRPLG
jgi:hypothetical protein